MAVVTSMLWMDLGKSKDSDLGFASSFGFLSLRSPILMDKRREACSLTS